MTVIICFIDWKKSLIVKTNSRFLVLANECVDPLQKASIYFPGRDKILEE